MLTHVYWMKISPVRKEENFEKALTKISEERRERVLSCKAEGERYRLLSAGVLLQRVLQSYGYDNSLLKKEKEGKPYLEGVENFHFNLSHSGDYVVCAVGKKPVGVDIQEYRKGTERIPQRFFQPEESATIEVQRRETREKMFFRYWTAKEAYGKLTGKGLAQGFDSFRVDLERGRILDQENPEQVIYLKEYFPNFGIESDSEKDFSSEKQQNYALTVCSYSPNFAEELQEIRF